MNKILLSQFFWIIATIVIAILFTNPAFGLIIGTVVALIFGNPQSKFTSKLSKDTLKLSVILLGFGVNFKTVITVGLSSIIITIIGIAFAMTVGYFLGRAYKVDKNITTLISSGTAICGGSAIAAIAPTINAKSGEIAISMAVVFILNAVGLLIFPPIGHIIGMSQEDFGLWAALAIHDTSSVVGAGAAYGATALAIATTVKLTRALWIMPLSFAIAKFNSSESKAQFPLFLLGFILAAGLKSLIPPFEPMFNIFSLVGKEMMSGILFLIGTGLTVEELKRVGSRPLLMAITLWVIVSIVTLLAIYFHIFKV